MLAVQVGEDGGHLVAQHPLQRQVGDLEDRDVRPVVPRRRRDLEPDPAGADHDDPAPRAEDGPDPVGVGKLAQVQDAVEIGAGHVETPRTEPVASSNRS